MREKVARILEGKGSELHTVKPTATVAEAVEVMNRHRIGSVIVIEGDKIAGIFTERDVLVRVVGEKRDPTRTTVRDVMTGALITIGPNTLVEDAMRITTDRRCRHLPVVDGSRLLGMISSGDLTRWVIRHQRAEITDLVDYVTS